MAVKTAEQETAHQLMINRLKKHTSEELLKKLEKGLVKESELPEVLAILKGRKKDVSKFEIQDPTTDLLVKESKPKAEKAIKEPKEPKEKKEKVPSKIDSEMSVKMISSFKGGTTIYGLKKEFDLSYGSVVLFLRKNGLVEKPVRAEKVK